MQSGNHVGFPNLDILVLVEAAGGVMAEIAPLRLGAPKAQLFKIEVVLGPFPAMRRFLFRAFELCGKF